MRPSARFPTSNALLTGPKFLGASATPQGALRWAFLVKVLMSFPVVSKISTAPLLKLLSTKVTYNLLLMFCTLYTVKPVSLGSEKDPTFLNVPSMMSTLLLTPVANPVYQAPSVAVKATTAEPEFTDGFQPLIVPGSKVSKMNSAAPDFP